MYRPVVPDNCKNWQVFSNDDHIEEFLCIADDYEVLFFEGSASPFKESIIEDFKAIESSIIQLKGNHIPKGLVSLEDIFDRHDRHVQDQRNLTNKTSVDYH